MKVLLLTDHMDRGGAETHLADLARQLTSFGVTVHILSEGGELARQLQAEGIRQFFLPVCSKNPFCMLRTRKKLHVLLKQEHYDILHAHARMPAFLMRGLRRHSEMGQIVTAHAKFRTFPFCRSLSYWGDYTIAVSEDLRVMLQKIYRVPAERVRVIPNGVDFRIFAPPVQKLSFSTPVEQKTRILFASRLDSDCSDVAKLLVSIAPQLVERFREIEIQIAGGGDAFDTLKQQADEINRQTGQELIIMRGHLSDMPDFFRSGNIFVGVSRAAMEACACGCSVILCGNEGYFGILTSENIRQAALTNFCARKEPFATEEALLKDLSVLLSKPKMNGQKSEHLRHDLYTLCDAADMARKTLALYHRAKKGQKTEKTITVGGYFGCGNLGDDAILSGFLEELHTKAPNVRPIVLTRHPIRDRRRFGVRCVNRKNPFAIMASLLSSDAFLCGGGSLLQNSTSNRSLLYYLMLLYTAHLMGATPILYAAGVGPLKGRFFCRFSRYVLRKCRYLSLRDPASYEVLSALGVDRARLHIGADAACLLARPPLSEGLYLRMHIGFSPTRPYLCVLLKGGKRDADIRRTTIAAVRMLAMRHGLGIVCLVFDQKHDKLCSIHASEALGAPLIIPQDTREALSWLTGASLTLTMRLHALILSTLAGTPCIGIAGVDHDPKIVSFAHLAAQDALSSEELSVGRLVECAENAILGAQSQRPIFFEVVADQRKKAKKDLENILSMLYNNR